jgi:hypothetical protein
MTTQLLVSNSSHCLGQIVLQGELHEQGAEVPAK